VRGGARRARPRALADRPPPARQQPAPAPPSGPASHRPLVPLRDSRPPPARPPVANARPAFWPPASHWPPLRDSRPPASRHRLCLVPLSAPNLQRTNERDRRQLGGPRARWRAVGRADRVGQRTRGIVVTREGPRARARWWAVGRADRVGQRERKGERERGRERARARWWVVGRVEWRPTGGAVAAALLGAARGTAGRRRAGRGGGGGEGERSRRKARATARLRARRGSKRGRRARLGPLAPAPAAREGVVAGSARRGCTTGRLAKFGSARHKSSGSAESVTAAPTRTARVRRCPKWRRRQAAWPAQRRPSRPSRARTWA
jgi:hypothetical protein